MYTPHKKKIFMFVSQISKQNNTFSRFFPNLFFVISMGAFMVRIKIISTSGYR